MTWLLLWFLWFQVPIPDSAAYIVDAHHRQRVPAEYTISPAKFPATAYYSAQVEWYEAGEDPLVNWIALGRARNQLEYEGAGVVKLNIPEPGEYFLTLMVTGERKSRSAYLHLTVIDSRK